MKPLPPGQQRVLDEIVAFRRATGDKYGPTVRHIAKMLGVRHSAVHRQLKVLKKKGLVTWNEHHGSLDVTTATTA